MHLFEEMGARLQAERKRLGLTQDQFAAVVQVSKRTLASYEAGTREPGAGLLNLAATVGVDVYFVLTGTQLPQAADSLSPEEAQVLAQFRMLSDGDRASVKRLTSALAATSGRP